MKVSDIILSERKWASSYPGMKGHFYFEARLAGTDEFSRLGKTRDEAEAACLKAVQEQAANLRKRAYFWSPSGKTVFVVSYTDCWHYEITSAGRPVPCACITGDTFEQCCANAERHAASYEE